MPHGSLRNAGEPRARFSRFFRPGVNFALQGPREGGKSFTAAWFASAALERDDYLVAANILCQRWLPAEGEPDVGTWEEAYPSRYHKVTSWYNLFWIIATALLEGKTVLFIIDEAGALSEGMQAGETSMNSHVRDVLSFLSICRHLNVSTIVITQSLELMGVKFREQKVRVIDIVVTKPSKSRKDVVIFENPEGERISARLGPFGLAHDKEWARENPGAIIYADSLAGFDRGVYPGTRIPFRFRELMNALRDQLPDRYPEIIREHLERPPIPQALNAAMEEVTITVDGEPERHEKIEKGGDIVRLLKSGLGPAAIRRQLNVSTGSVSYWRGKIARGEA